MPIFGCDRVFILLRKLGLGKFLHLAPFVQLSLIYMAPKDINTLQNAFPDIPHDIIETILESNLGDVDKALDSLLEMSDPDFHSNDNRASDMATSAARPASQRSRVSFQEPVDNYVQVLCLTPCQ
jgi:CUE domain